MNRLLVIAALAACTEVVDVEPPGDYTTWTRIDTWGSTPGHGDTYRIIYVNDMGKADPPPIGTILVKEVYDRAPGSTPAPGALRVIELGRRTGEDPDQQGWLFTATGEPNGEETVGTFCWRRCHQAAPYTGAWFDYSKF
jgi:hypothetical protein